MKSELKKLGEVLPKINSIPNVNYGGCGVVAEHIYRYLYVKGYKPKILTLTHNEEYLNKAIANNETAEEGKDHVIVKVGRLYIDSTGLYTCLREVPYAPSRKAVPTPYNLLVQWNGIGHIWNDSFDRANIKKIKNIIDSI